MDENSIDEGEVEYREVVAALELPGSALEMLQAVYRDPMQPLSVRIRAAREALPFESPKLSATAITTMDGKSFAEALERAIKRSKGPTPARALIEAQPLPTTELSKPFSRLVRRF
jgi:hypothetical protein